MRERKITGRVTGNQKGFTLIEAVCSLALIAVIFTAFAIQASSASQTNMQAQRLDEAFGEATASLYRDGGSSGTITLNVGGSGYQIPVTMKKSSTPQVLQMFEPKE